MDGWMEDGYDDGQMDGGGIDDGQMDEEGQMMDGWLEEGQMLDGWMVNGWMGGYIDRQIKLVFQRYILKYYR